MKNKSVHCKDCGYLARVDIEKPPHFPSKEVGLPMRQPSFWMATYWPIRCHEWRANLDEELRTYSLVSGGEAIELNPIPGLTELKDFGAWERVINKERECEGFTPYMQGLSPDEHKAEERRQLEKRKTHQQAVKVAVIGALLTAGLTAGLLTFSDVLSKLFWD